MFIPSWDPSGRTRHFICILKTEGDFSSESSAGRRDFADTKSNAERQGSGEAGRVPRQRQAGLQRGCWGEGRRGGDTQGGAGHCCTHTRTHVHRHAHRHTHARMLTSVHTLTHSCAPTHAFTLACVLSIPCTHGHTRTLLLRGETPVQSSEACIPLVSAQEPSPTAPVEKAEALGV